MSFYLVRDEGGGCDYSIRCGLDLKKIHKPDGTEPSSLEEAEQIVVTSDDYLGPMEVGDPEEPDYFETGYLCANWGDNDRLASARILEVVQDHAIEMQLYINESQARVSAAHAKQAKAAELTLLAQLKAKYE